MYQIFLVVYCPVIFTGYYGDFFVITNKITVVGKDSLKILLDKFPKNEYLFWQAKLLGDEEEHFSLPDQNTVNEIKDYASQKELNFNVVE